MITNECYTVYYLNILREEFEVIYREMTVKTPIIEDFYYFLEDIRNYIKHNVPEYYDASCDPIIIPYINTVLNFMNINPDFKNLKNDVFMILDQYTQLPDIRYMNTLKKRFKCKFSVNRKRIRIYYTRGYYEHDLYNIKV
jgi:hypothetical protein